MRRRTSVHYRYENGIFAKSTVRKILEFSDEGNFVLSQKFIDSSEDAHECILIAYSAFTFTLFCLKSYSFFNATAFVSKKMEIS